MWAQAVSTAIGVWIYASPSVLDHDGAGAALDRIAGALIITFAFVAIWEHVRGVRLANRPVAVALLVLPWFLEQPAAGVVSSVVGGAVVLALTFAGGDVDEDAYGGGWSALVRSQR